MGGIGTSLTCSAINGDVTAMVRGEIVRLSGANDNVVKALADSAPHVAGLLGVVVSGRAAVGGRVLVAPFSAADEVLCVAGLTLAVGEALYISAVTAGSLTNVAPAVAARVGSVKSTSGYTRTSRVSAVLGGVGGGGGSGSGAISVTANTGLTGDGTVGTPLAGVPSSASVPGTMSAADFTKLLATVRPIEGTALTNADQTVQPFTDKASLYRITAARTANRVCTVGVNSVFNGLTVYFLREDTAAFTETLTNGGTNGGNPFVFGASPTTKELVALYNNGVDWLLVGFWYVLST